VCLALGAYRFEFCPRQGTRAPHEGSTTPAGGKPPPRHPEDPDTGAGPRDPGRGSTPQRSAEIDPAGFLRTDCARSSRGFPWQVPDAQVVPLEIAHCGCFKRLGGGRNRYE
jgi:hypothetical protein